MFRARIHKWTRLFATAGLLLQITACLGSDPQFYLTSVAVSTLVSNVVTTIYQLLLGGLSAGA